MNSRTFTPALLSLFLVAACSGSKPEGSLIGPDPRQDVSGNEPGVDPQSGLDAGVDFDATTNPPPPPPPDAGTKDTGPKCPSNKKECGAVCASLDDPAYGCGSCLACPSAPIGTPVCEKGKCSFKCPVGNNLCLGACVPESAGACGASCQVCPTPSNAFPDCKGGLCGFTCAAGYLDCDRLKANGCEVDGNNDSYNCGSCGHRCGPDQTCFAGSCF